MLSQPYEMNLNKNVMKLIKMLCIIHAAFLSSDSSILVLIISKLLQAKNANRFGKSQYYHQEMHVAIEEL